MKKKFNGKFSLAVCLLAMSVIFSSCMSTGETEETSVESQMESVASVEEESSKEESSEQESSEEEAVCVNPLTGLEIDEDALDAKPVAVMINNIKAAQPLMGISRADIAYECLVEGGITRIVAIYKDVSSVDTIGSIRSARPPFIELACGFDALYICCGTSTQANTLLKQNVIDYFDLAYYSSMSWRDQDRVSAGYATEHTLVSSGSTIASEAEEYGVDMTSDKTYSQQFGADTQCTDGDTANEVTATFSSYKSTTFIYDSETGKYTVWQFGSQQYDDTYDCANAVENVLILNVNSYLIDSEHINLDLSGFDGTGYYFTGGKYIKIKWSKASSDDPIVYTTEDGEELIMTPGRQYVCCVPLNSTPSIS